MGKETFYFSHDYNPTGDPKIAAMISEHGACGYGYFWRITEMLHSEPNHFLPLKKYIFLAIAKQMLANVETVEKFINECISDYELFITDGVNFWSNRVNSNLGERAKLSEKRALAGKKGAIAKQTLAIAKQQTANVSKGKEIKGKENKVKDIIEEIFVPPLIEEVEAYFFENGYSIESAKMAFRHYDTSNWVDKNGKQVKNWKQKMNSVWFKPENKIQLQAKRTLQY